MDTQKLSHSNLWIGDAVAIALVTIIGFGFHGGIQFTDINRVFALFLPYVAAWVLFGIPLGVFKPENVGSLKQLWRIAVAVVLATPIAAWLRAIWLDTAVVPVFVIVLAATGALGLLIWRMAYIIYINRMRKPTNE